MCELQIGCNHVYEITLTTAFIEGGTINKIDITGILQAQLHSNSRI